jgi:hypothetical protein
MFKMICLWLIVNLIKKNEILNHKNKILIIIISFTWKEKNEAYNIIQHDNIYYIISLYFGIGYKCFLKIQLNLCYSIIQYFLSHVYNSKMHWLLVLYWTNMFLFFNFIFYLFYLFSSLTRICLLESINQKLIKKCQKIIIRSFVISPYSGMLKIFKNYQYK